VVQRRPPLAITPVKQQEQLEAVCDKCRAEGRFAFDTEFVMEDRFETEVCLIQIASRDSVAIIDPYLDLDLGSVWGLVVDRDVQTVVHAGQEDLALCVQHTGKTPHNVFDVQIAAGFTDQSYPLSLQKLVQTTLHVQLHKSRTLTDWRKRPLSAEQTRYAAEDVAYLLEARERLHNELERRDRLAWAREEFDRFEELSLYRRAEEEKLLRLKGSGALKGRQLAVVRELLEWREALAKRFNRPVRTVLKDHLLVEIARLELDSFQAVRDLRGLNLGDRHVHSLCRAVKKAVKTPREKWPTLAPRESESSKDAPVIALATAVIRGYCLEAGVAYGLVASKRSILELVNHVAKGRPANRKEIELLNGWRGQAVGAMLEDVLSGRSVITIEARDRERFVRVAKGDR
jgi:ribonuclease D